jgi:L-amino acid N-acyltransferase
LSGLLIRSAVAADVPAILDIFNTEILGGVNAFDTQPIEGAAQDAWFAVHADPRFPLLVATDGDVIAGWASLSPWARHGAYEKTAELSIFIHANRRSRRIGTDLMHRLIDCARAAGHHVLLGRAEASNEASRRLHLACGFSEIALMREVGWKKGRYLDVAIFQLIL